MVDSKIVEKKIAIELSIVVILPDFSFQLPNNGNQYEEKYLQVAETTFSQASPLPVEEGQITAGHNGDKIFVKSHFTRH